MSILCGNCDNCDSSHNRDILMIQNRDASKSNNR